MDSNGPVGRLRGTPQQILDRYSVLARDASTSGDMVLAENLWQHAEHYVRLLTLNAPQQQNAQQEQRYGNGRDEVYDFDDQDDSSGNDDANNSGEPRQQRHAEIAPQAKSPVTPPPEAQADNQSPPQQPDKPTAQSTPQPVWTPADAQTASAEPQQQPEPEQRTGPPRRRRRTRFQRQQDADEAANAAGGTPSPAAAAEPAETPQQAVDQQPPVQPRLALPEDRSPAALIDLLTQAESRAGNSDDDRREEPTDNSTT